AVASFTLEGKLLAEMWPRVFFTSLIITSGKFGASVGRPQLFGSQQYHLPPSLSLVTAPVACIDSIIHYAASTTAVRIDVRDSLLSVSRIELCFFFFYSVTDVISNVAKYNTSVKIYLSKSKITDLKNYLKITKYTKKLLNYSN